MASICSCENASNAAWATRASATSRSTLLGVVELDFLRPPPTAYSAVGLTISGFLRVGAPYDANGSARSVSSTNAGRARDRVHRLLFLLRSTRSLMTCSIRRQCE